MEPGSTNPFLLDHIVEKIFDSACLSNSDFLNLRSVCVEWHQAASKRYQLPLVLLEEEWDIRKMSTAVSLIQNPSGNLPFLKRIEFGSGFFPNSDIWGFQPIFGKFLSLISNEVENIILQMYDNCTLDFAEECYCDIGIFPRLKTLSLELSWDQNHPCSTSFFHDLSEKILRKSPFVQSLAIFSYSPNPLGLSRTDFGNKLLLKIPRSITYLCICKSFTSYEANVFSLIHLPNLTTLFLTSIQQTSGNDLYNLFSNNKNSLLTALKLHIFQQNILDFKLPIFPNVTLLELWIVADPFIPNTDFELSFPTIFPNVGEVVIRGHMTPAVMLALFPDGFAAPLLKTCTLEIDGLGQAQVLNLALGFLGLTKLTILAHRPIDSLIGIAHLSGLSTIFSWCLGLEELDLRFDEKGIETDFDSILTGIPPNLCQNFGNALNLDPNWDADLLLQVKDSPGLSDLSNLKILRISALSPSPVNITNATGYFGFLQLPKLKKLSTGKFQMSEEFIAVLRLRFGENFILY